MRLLVVDDSPLDRALIAELGRLNGVEVCEATQQDAALRLAVDVDVVLLDGHMPGIDAAELAGLLRGVTPARIVLWSGAPEAIEARLPEGAVDQIVSKPSDLNAMEHAFRATLVMA